MSPKPKLVDSHGGRDAMMDKLLGMGAVTEVDVEASVEIPEATAPEEPEATPAPVVVPEPSAVGVQDDAPADDVEESVSPAPADGSHVTPAAVASAVKKYGDDPRFQPPLVVAAGRVDKVQLANRVTIPLKHRVDRHKARTGESINSLLERLLDFGLEIAEAEAGVDADGNPVQK